MPANRFTLTVTLGNDAMCTWADLARMLRAVADKIDEQHEDAPQEGDGSIRDDNGNRVGKWETTS